MGDYFRDVVKRVDLLDGRKDNKYFNQPLLNSNATGACTSQYKRCSLDQRQKKICPLSNVPMINYFNQTVSIDCNKLFSNLDKLGRIFSKIGASILVGYYPAVVSKAVLNKTYTFAEIFAASLIHNIIESLLYGNFMPRKMLGLLVDDVSIPSIFDEAKRIYFGLTRNNYRGKVIKNPSDAKRLLVDFKGLFKKSKK